MHTPNPEIKGQRLAKGLYYDIGLQLMKLLNILLIVAAFAGCWLLYYVNRVIMRPSPLRSAGVILLFTFLYSFFGRVYDIMHCNTPSGGMVGRICAHQMKTPKVIYMAHGFHFWKGAPLKNWLLYYPVERFLAHFTDRLITINHEDYARAQRFHFKKGGKAVYIPGVGIDPKKYAPDTEKRANKRQELGILDGETMLLSVGEVNQNKNHKVVIEALAKWQRKDIRYVICGIGPMEAELKKLVETLGLAAQVTFAGYRTDIGDYYQAADVFVISSYREGLPVAPMEAMTACIPCVASRIRGSVDLLADSSLLFDAGDSDISIILWIHRLPVVTHILQKKNLSCVGTIV